LHTGTISRLFPFLQFRGFLPEFSGGLTMLGGLLFMRDRFSNPASSQTLSDFVFYFLDDDESSLKPSQVAKNERH